MAQSTGTFVPAVKCGDIDMLQASLETLDAISQERLTQIAAIATVAAQFSKSIKYPSLATVLEVIARDAEELLYAINSEAGSLGCAHSDEEGEAA